MVQKPQSYSPNIGAMIGDCRNKGSKPEGPA